MIKKKVGLIKKKFMRASYKGEVESLPGQVTWILSVKSLEVEGNFKFYHVDNKETMAIFIEFTNLMKVFCDIMQNNNVYQKKSKNKQKPLKTNKQKKKQEYKLHEGKYFGLKYPLK